MNLTKTKFLINDDIWFNGATAVEGTDFTNNGCTVTYEPVVGTPNDYSISNSTIVFTTALESTDKIAVEVFA